MHSSACSSPSRTPPPHNTTIPCIHCRTLNRDTQPSEQGIQKTQQRRRIWSHPSHRTPGTTVLSPKQFKQQTPMDPFCSYASCRVRCNQDTPVQKEYIFLQCHASANKAYSLVVKLLDNVPESDSGLFEARFRKPQVLTTLTEENLISLKLVKDSPDGMMFGQICMSVTCHGVGLS